MTAAPGSTIMEGIGMIAINMRTTSYHIRCCISTHDGSQRTSHVLDHTICCSKRDVGDVVLCRYVVSTHIYIYIYMYICIYIHVGIMRLTANMKIALIDRTYVGIDQEAIDMAYYLLKNEGIWVGPSAALNVVGTVKLARELGAGHNLVTVLCDSGDKVTNERCAKYCYVAYI